MGFCLLSDPSLCHLVCLVILGMVGMGAKLNSKEREKQQRLCNKNANLCITSFFSQLVFLQKVINKHRTGKATKTITITKGMSSSKSTSSGGSSSVSVSGKVGLSAMKLFEATIGASGTFEHNWSLSTTRTEYQEVASKISIGVKPGSEVSVSQVVGECKNSDGTVYTVKTPTYVIRGKDGLSETKEADFSEAEKRLS